MQRPLLPGPGDARENSGAELGRHSGPSVLPLLKGLDQDLHSPTAKLTDWSQVFMWIPDVD